MRKSSLKKTFGFFREWTNWDIDFLNKVYNTHRMKDSHKESRKEKEQIVEAFVFKICANWEVFTEDLLIDCLNKDTMQFANHTGFRIPKHLSRDVCKAMIVGVGYIDFKNVSHLKGFAKKILVPDNNPFKEICQKPTSDKIDEFYTMRNYLAHYSYAAARKLEGVYKKKGIKFREPGDYLLSFERKNSKRRINVYINAFVKAANEMATFLGI